MLFFFNHYNYLIFYTPFQCTGIDHVLFIAVKFGCGDWLALQCLFQELQFLVSALSLIRFRIHFGVGDFLQSLNAALVQPTCCSFRETPPIPPPPSALLSSIPAALSLSLLTGNWSVNMAANRVIIYGGRGALGSKCVEYFKSKGWVSGDS